MLRKPSSVTALSTHSKFSYISSFSSAVKGSPLHVMANASLQVRHTNEIKATSYKRTGGRSDTTDQKAATDIKELVYVQEEPYLAYKQQNKQYASQPRRRATRISTQHARARRTKQHTSSSSLRAPSWSLSNCLNMTVHASSAFGLKRSSCQTARILSCLKARKASSARLLYRRRKTCAQFTYFDAQSSADVALTVNEILEGKPRSRQKTQHTSM